MKHRPAKRGARCRRASRTAGKQPRRRPTNCASRRARRGRARPRRVSLPRPNAELPARAKRSSRATSPNWPDCASPSTRRAVARRWPPRHRPPRPHGEVQRGERDDQGVRARLTVGTKLSDDARLASFTYGSFAQSAFLMTHWASRGFVVVAPDIPGIGLLAALGGEPQRPPLGVATQVLDLLAEAPAGADQASLGTPRARRCARRTPPRGR